MGVAVDGIEGGSMNRIAILAALFCVVFAGSVVGATGTYVAAEIEMFRPWGILNWGSWETLDTRFITSRFASLAEEDVDRIAELEALCADSSLGIDSEACALLAGLVYRAEQSLAMDAELGRDYRIVLTNLTDATLGVVLGVDGLNSNGNEPIVGDATDRKWILLPNQTVHIAGWQVSADEALQFRFATPSRTHSPIEEEHGGISVFVYLPNPLGTDHVKGTEAGAVIGQPTVRIPFASATNGPAETIAFDYSSDSIRLGILCTETDGPGIRVVSVIDGTIASLKGLHAGDVITYADARPIDSCQDLGDLLAAKSPGDRIVVKVHRAERVFLLTLELGG
jgi:hypothetical protein